MVAHGDGASLVYGGCLLRDVWRRLAICTPKDGRWRIPLVVALVLLEFHAARCNSPAMGTEWRCPNHGEKYNPWSDWCHHRSIGFIYAGYAFGDAKGQSQPQVSRWWGPGRRGSVASQFDCGS